MKVQLHNYVRSFSTNLLGDLVSDPPAGQFSKMVNLLTDHLKDAGSAVDKSEQVNKTKADVINGNLNVILRYKAVITWLILFDLHMRLSLATVDQPNGNNLVMSKPMWQGWI